MVETRQTLIIRLRNPSAEADWEDFYQQYWRIIIRYAMKLGLAEDAAEDVLQETMMALLKTMPTFDYDPKKGRFLNFLLTITHRKAIGIMRKRSRESSVPLDRAPLVTDETAASAFEQMEQRWQQSVWEEAWQRFRDDISIEKTTIDVFQAYVINGDPPDQVAQRFKMKTNAVYRVKNRVVKRLQREARHLLNELELEPAS
ncbi:MAG: sigma-70 family RNA polymerase sigma factor [Verrucomicrobiota bacterium]